VLQEKSAIMPEKNLVANSAVRSETIDPAEIERFSALAEEWWSPDGKFRVVHKFNPVRRDFIVDRIARHFDRRLSAAIPFDGLKILDVGCGAGLLCEPMAEQGANVVGIDATERNVEVARWHAAQVGLSIDYRHCLAANLLAANERFDVVLNTEVIEHVADPEQFMRDCCQLVKPGGLMVVATLNRTLRAFLLAIVGAEYVLRWLPRGTHDWRRFLRPGEISGMLERHGLKTTHITGVTFNPIANHWRLSANASVNYMLVAEKPPS
jgi:2-polyprenyl-6-hydroxyphenyl methylase/3-demethylubiquinone-9 3-methyltransferase